MTPERFHQMADGEPRRPLLTYEEFLEWLEAEHIPEDRVEPTDWRRCAAELGRRA